MAVGKQGESTRDLWNVSQQDRLNSDCGSLKAVVSLDLD